MTTDEDEPQEERFAGRLTFAWEPSDTFNATLKYTSPGGGIEELGFVRNFLDKDYKVQSFDLTSGRGFIVSVYGEPRTFGVGLTVSFD